MVEMCYLSHLQVVLGSQFLSEDCDSRVEDTGDRYQGSAALPRSIEDKLFPPGQKKKEKEKRNPSPWVETLHSDLPPRLKHHLAKRPPQRRTDSPKVILRKEEE